MGEIVQFMNNLLDSVQHYLKQKKDLDRVSRLETEYFIERVGKAHKAIGELFVGMARDLEDLKPAIDVKFAKALEFTSMLERDDSQPSFHQPGLANKSDRKSVV